MCVGVCVCVCVCVYSGNFYTYLIFKKVALLVKFTFSKSRQNFSLKKIKIKP